MSPFEQFDTDPELEVHGVWLDFGGFRLKCRPSGEDNPDFVRVYNELVDPVREALEQKVLPNAEEVERGFLITAYAETVIVDADGNFAYPDGKTIPKTVKGFQDVLTKLPRLFRQVRRKTLAVATYRRVRDNAKGKE